LKLHFHVHPGLTSDRAPEGVSHKSCLLVSRIPCELYPITGTEVIISGEDRRLDLF